MSAELCTHGRAMVMLLVAIACAPAVSAQTSPSTFKIAYWNVQSGKGEPPLPGRVAPFADVANCTDPTQPLNAWGVGFFQQHLINAINADPKIVALGLGESWPSVCASPENIRQTLGWKSRTSSQNGVAMVAKYGFVGGEEWLQLDTTLNTNPADTMWVLRMRVCLEATCVQTMNVFVAHWYGTGTSKNTTYDRQGRQTADFLVRTGGSEPHVLTGDLNAWDGTVDVCGQSPNNAGLQPLRDAGYVDAWPLLHGSAEGFTGMTNRAGCGVPEGYAYKRIDYAWSPRSFLPVSIARFGMVTPGDAAPSDHYGIVTELPMPGGSPAPSDTIAPNVSITAPMDGLTVTGGPVTIAIDATDDVGVARVEILEDGVPAHTLTSAPFSVSCASIATTSGRHVIGARAYDAAGNVALAQPREIFVDLPEDPPPAPSPGDIVLYAKNANAIAGDWQSVPDGTAAGGARMWNPDRAAAKLVTALANPADYFEAAFPAEAGRAYRLWFRGRAERDYWGNDSAYFQFSGSVTQSGAPIYRIGTDSATWLGVEDCSGCVISGWGWNDNAYGTGAIGVPIYFETTGTQRLRVQRREDGLSIDQIVLSPERYWTTAPGALTNDATILPETSTAPPPPPPPAATEVLMTATNITALAGAWQVVDDAAAAGGKAIWNRDAGAPKVKTAAAAPASYVDLTFYAEAGRAYRLWMRARADRDSWKNDSVFVQFSGSATTAGAAIARIGTGDAFVVNLEDDANVGLAGWGWQDNGYGAGVLGPLITFASTGTQTIRIQPREDGLRFDQIVLSSQRYLISAPGALKNDSTVLSPGQTTDPLPGEDAGPDAVAVSYSAITDRETRVEPPLPAAGPVGTTLTDPAFGSTISRVTDGATRPERPGTSFRTPSGTHQHAWSARGSHFYLISSDGTLVPFRFDPASGSAARVPGTTNGGLTLRFFNEAQFSYVDDNLIYATYNGSGATLRTVDQYDFATGTYSTLLDLDTVVSGLTGTLVGGIGSSAGAVEKILAFFGGPYQDQHHYAIVFEKSAPARRRVLDTLASTLDGAPTPTALAFRLHHATIDRSGRYVLLYPSAVDLAAPRLAAHVYVWDTATDSIVALGAAANPNGHDAPGYGMLVNQDCCTTSTWDAAQWQWRSLATPTTPRDLIAPVLSPKHVYLADHPSWHNARPEALVPFVSALYRYGAEASEWRAWDDEIVAIQTDVAPAASAIVWRLAHHRSDVANDSDPSRIYFWYTPRPQVSPDGRWVLFTSNWEKTLGADPFAEPGGTFRQDVFLLRTK